ncbi:hypothetical protein [Sutterella sp.]|nr:hypothetical protein [Sutterella sp.]MDO5531408.1 hypothetical protein [Sutterella sp.]
MIEILVNVAGFLIGLMALGPLFGGPNIWALFQDALKNYFQRKRER